MPAETRAYVGGITRTLKVASLERKLTRRELVKLTRPDGVAVKIDPASVTDVRAPLPGEYDWSVKAVLTLHHKKQQAVRENVALARSALQAAGDVT